MSRSMLFRILLIAIALIGSSQLSMATYRPPPPPPPPPATPPCERNVTSDCTCNCDCGEIVKGENKTCKGGRCPAERNVKCITCANMYNNWECDIYGEPTECDEAAGETYCLGEYHGEHNYSRRCATKQQCLDSGRGFITGRFVAGPEADGNGCKNATCEVYGCLGLESPDDPETKNPHCSIQYQSSRQWVPAGKGLGLCGCDSWCVEFYSNKTRCDCCEDYFSFCARDSFIYQQLTSLVNDPINQNNMTIQSWRCDPTIGKTYGRYRNKYLRFTDCVPINSEDTACLSETAPPILA